MSEMLFLTAKYVLCFKQWTNYIWTFEEQGIYKLWKLCLSFCSWLSSARYNFKLNKLFILTITKYRRIWFVCLGGHCRWVAYTCKRANFVSENPWLNLNISSSIIIFYLFKRWLTQLFNFGLGRQSNNNNMTNFNKHKKEKKKGRGHSIDGDNFDSGGGNWLDGLLNDI